MKVIKRFESFDAFLRQAQGETLMLDIDRSSRDRGRTEWYGTASFDEAVEVARHGYSDVRPIIRGITDKIVDTMKDRTVTAFERRLDVSGGVVDIARFLEGEPEHMVETYPVEVSEHGRVISILVSGSMSAMVDAVAIRNRGAAIAALVELLEMAGHNTEVWWERTISPGRGARGVTGGPDRHTLLVKVKGTDERLDLDQLSFVVAHPSMLRRISFSVSEVEDGKVRAQFGFFNGGGYGRTADALECVEEVSATVVMPTKVGSFVPEKWVRDNLGALGLLVEEATA